LAIDAVTFYDNSTAFWDEYLAHRIGLMPIKTPADLPAEVELIFSLDVEGPKTAYSSDFKCSDKDISMAKEKIIAVTLATNQHLRLEGRAVLGTGRKHAKFQAGIVSYGEEDKGLRFMVESFFQMEPYEVLSRGCGVIESQLDDIESALTGKKKEVKPKSEAKKKATKKATKKTETSE